MVFQILSENDLCNYYDLEAHPGISLKSKNQGDRFEYLNSPPIIQRLLDFQDETQSHISFYLPQIHCSSCIWLLEKLYKLREGVVRTQVNFLKKELTVVFEHEKLSLRELVELLASIGYEPEINLQDLKQKKSSRYNRRLFYQLGIAGFAFGNIMLLSFPEYFSLQIELGEEFAIFFGYLNLVLSLPVLLYSAQDYLRSAWYSIRQKGLNIDVPISIGILTLFGRSGYEILSQTGPGYLDAMVGLVFFLLIGKWFQQKTYDTLSFERQYESYFPVAVMRKEAGEWKSTALPELEVGDHVLIRNQELIPADCLLINGQANVDYSFVTGESEPVRRKLGEHIYAGGRQIGASVELELTKAVDQSYLTKLWNAEAFEQSQEKHSLFHLADKIGKYFTLAILAIAFGSGIAWLVIEPGMAIHVFTSVLIIACPCALALTSPFTFGNALRILGKKGFYLKNPQVVERMAHISHVVFDKTGTLTHGQKLEWEEIGGALSEREKSMLYNLSLQSTHPLSRAISAFLEGSPKIAWADIEAVEEIAGKGLQARIDGQQLHLGSADFVGSVLAAPQNLAPKGSYFVINGQLRAHCLMQSSYRPQLREIIDRLKKALSFSLLSGDHPGEQARLQAFFPPETPMRFLQSPFDKLAYIRQAQQNGAQIMMIGDGLNDAGALKQSDVGIAISEDINNFSPACDAILDAKSFELLPGIFRFSQKSYQLVKIGFIFSLVYNVVGLGFAVQGLLSPVVAAILMPLSSISIIVFAVGATYWMGRRIFKK